MKDSSSELPIDDKSDALNRPECEIDLLYLKHSLRTVYAVNTDRFICCARHTIWVTVAYDLFVLVTPRWREEKESHTAITPTFDYNHYHTENRYTINAFSIFHNSMHFDESNVLPPPMLTVGVCCN